MSRKAVEVSIRGFRAWQRACIAWKAQIRLCGRFRRLAARGKKSQLVVTAIARELAGFVWAVSQAAAACLSKKEQSVWKLGAPGPTEGTLETDDGSAPNPMSRARQLPTNCCHAVKPANKSLINRRDSLVLPAFHPTRE